MNPSRIKPLLVVVAMLVCAQGAALKQPSLAPLAAGQAASATQLGDLTTFRRIVVEVSGMVDTGELGAAKVRIKDLEMSWDNAEPSLKPRAAPTWHTVDKAIDRALSALRADKPDRVACKKALDELLVEMDRASGKG